jgi:hypothetical protein
MTGASGTTTGSCTRARGATDDGAGAVFAFDGAVPTLPLAGDVALGTSRVIELAARLTPNTPR